MAARIELRCVTFNLLADGVYSDCLANEQKVSFERRLAGLITTLTNQNADILALQECPGKHFDEISAKLGPDFAGCYCPRLDFIFGQAIFWRVKRFYCQLQANLSLSSDNVHTAALAVLSCRYTLVTFAVFNAHISARYKEPMTQWEQAFSLVEGLVAVRRRYPSAACIMCGDYNSLPDSLVYRYLTSLQVNLASAYKACHGHDPEW
jgi:mRNA deadenylase 3'-5' endonuclease subunit Ccr4